MNTITKINNIKHHSFFRVEFGIKEEYNLPKYKGTPSRTNNCGDFKLLKKAHISSYQQKPKCKICDKVATLYVCFLDQTNQLNSCEDCALDIL